MRVIAFVAALLLTLTACGDSTRLVNQEPVEKTPRIVSLAPHIAELVFAAGAGDYLVGVSAYSDYPAEVQALPVVSDGFSLNVEALLEVRPTIILAWQGGGQSRMVALAESLGIPLVRVPGERVEDIASALRQIGRIAGTSSTAEAAAQAFERALRELEPAATSVNVFYQIGQQPLYTVGGRHFISDLITRCGGRNVFEDLTEAAPAVSLEAVIASDPDVILTGEAAVDDARKLWAQWPSMQAVANDHVLGLPADIVTRPGPRLADGAAAVCAKLRSATEGDR